MIDAIEPGGEPGLLVTADIETGSKGELLDVNLAYEDEYYTFTSWEAWLNHIHEHKAIKRVWFHNGGNFDVVGLFVLIMKGYFDPIIEDWVTIMVGGTPICLKLTFLHRGKFKRRVLSITDSLRLMPSSLDKLAKDFGFPGKDEVPAEYKSRMEVFRAKHPAEYHAYHKQDTLLLKRILADFTVKANEIAPIGELPMTVASLSMKVFRTRFVKEAIQTPSRRERDFTRLAYQGGRCEYVGDYPCGYSPYRKRLYEGVNTYDVNSQYPSVMQSSLFPICPGTFTDNERDMRYQDGTIRPGCYL